MAELLSVEPHGAQDIETICSRFLFLSPTILLSIILIKQLFKLWDYYLLIVCGNCQRFKFAKEICPFVKVTSFGFTGGAHREI